jgi:TetR/AcrR family transcriptional repressor of nem operon
MARTDSSAKDKILDSAQKLMLKKGFVATTIDEICETSELTKGCFFHYFKNKEELGKAVLDHYWNFLQTKMQEDHFLQEEDPLERIFGFMDFAVNSVSRNPALENGCLVGILALELSKTNEPIRMICSDYFCRMSGLLIQLMDEAKAKYAPEKNIDTQSLADALVSLVQGSFLVARTKQDQDLVENNTDHFKTYLKNIFGR